MGIATQTTGAKGGDKSFKSENTPGVREERGVVIGKVKVNSHPSAMGVLQVFVPNVGDDSNRREEETSQWRTVRYATPFYSRTDALAPGGSETAVKNTSGIVYPCPDVGSKVLCVFPSGKNQEGVWFACAPDPYMMQALPEASMTSNFDKTGLESLVRHDKAPGLEFNDIENDVRKLTNFSKPQRGVNITRSVQLKTQGIDQDEVRGLSSSNVMRETPSEVFGITTKGRRTDIRGQDLANRKDILDKLESGTDLSTSDARAVEGKIGRKQGHTLVMDDGDIEGGNNLMRFRTAGGHQILLHDTEDIIYIGNSKGTSWVQMDANGQLDIFSRSNINFRSRSMNFHADSTMKFHAGKQIQMVSGGSLHLEGKAMANLYSDGQTFLFGGKGTNIKSGASLNMQGGSTVGIKASGNMDLSASCIALNGAARPAMKQNSIPVIGKNDVKQDSRGFWVQNSGALRTTVDRVPTHEPFNEHRAVTQESTFTTVSVADVPDSGELKVKQPKLPIPVLNQGLDFAKDLQSTGQHLVTGAGQAAQQLVSNTVSNTVSSLQSSATSQFNELFKSIVT